MYIPKHIVHVSRAMVVPVYSCVYNPNPTPGLGGLQRLHRHVLNCADSSEPAVRQHVAGLSPPQSEASSLARAGL